MRRCQNGMGVMFLRSLLEKGRFGKKLLQDTARRWLLPQATKKGWFGLNKLLDVGYRVKFPDRSGLTAGVRFRLTGPVSPVTGRNRPNENLNSNFPVVTVLTGIPAGLAGNRSV